MLVSLKGDKPDDSWAFLCQKCPHHYDGGGWVRFTVTLRGAPKILAFEVQRNRRIVADELHFVSFGVVDVQAPPLNPVVLCRSYGVSQAFQSHFFRFVVRERDREGDVVEGAALRDVALAPLEQR